MSSSTITLHPRVQHDRWSLYWKESMATKTDVLEPVEIVNAAPIDWHAIVQDLGASLGWPTLAELRKCRLEGFEGPFVRVLQGGRVLWDDTSAALRDVDTSGHPVVVVQQRLVAEGWQLRTPDSWDLWSDTDEEEAWQE